MTRRSRKLRNAKYRIAQENRVHDLTGNVVLPANAKVVVDQIDDSWGQPEFARYDPRKHELVSSGQPKVAVIRSIRSDPLGALKAQGVIDEAQFLAGKIWSWNYMQSEIGGLRAIDPTREAVDGGRLAEPLTERQKLASSQLRKAKLALGNDGDALVTDIIGKGLTIAKAADARGLFNEFGRKYIGRRFKECLDCLAVVFGCATAGASTGNPHHNLTPVR